GRALYLYSECLREIAAATARRDWKVALHIAGDIPDKKVRSHAVGEVVGVRLANRCACSPDELAGLLAAVDAIGQEDCRCEAWEGPLRLRTAETGWSDEHLSDLIHRLSLGSRATFNYLLGPLVTFVRRLRPRALDGFAPRHVRDIVTD